MHDFILRCNFTELNGNLLYINNKSKNEWINYNELIDRFTRRTLETRFKKNTEDIATIFRHFTV